MSEKPTIKGRIIALGIGLVALILLSEIILRITMPQWREFYSGHFIQMTSISGHPKVALGKPGFDGYLAQNNGDFRARISINGFGLRNPEPVTMANGRIWVVGDSMTFGWGVEQDEMYSSVLAQLTNRSTYNIASPGTDACGYQTLLDRMPDALVPKAVVIGLVLENDISIYNCSAQAKQEQRMLKDRKGDISEGLSGIGVKRLLTKHTALYNFMAISLKRVDVFREALIMVGLVERSHGYRQNIDEVKLVQSLESTAAELGKLRSMLPQGTPFVVLLVPGRPEVKSDNKFYRKLRLGMTAQLKKRGISLVDPFPHFKKFDFLDTHFAHDGHWSKKGHDLAARALAEWIKRKGY